MTDQLETCTTPHLEVTTDVLSLTVQEYAALLEKEHKITLLPPDLDTTAEDNMLACRVYDCMDLLLVLGRQRSNEIAALFNALPPSDPSTIDSTMEGQQQHQVLEHKRQALLFLLTRGKLGQGCRIDPPIQVDYGHNLTLGNQVIWGSSSVALDCARISIGDRTILGPGVKLLGATHPTNPLLRNPERQFDYAMEINIGKDCWVGGGVVVCPGVTIGDGVTVQPGSVVSKNVPSFVVVAGCPAKIVEVLERERCEQEGQALEAFLKAWKKEGENGKADGDVKIEEFFDQWRPPTVETMVLP
jgi:maltose O-acetyltransferase